MFDEDPQPWSTSAPPTMLPTQCSLDGQTVRLGHSDVRWPRHQVRH